MERSSQPPKTEGCSTEEQAPIDLWFYRAERPSERRTQEQARAASGTRIPLKQSSLESLNTGGDEVTVAEPNTVRADNGKARAGRSGSESVARAEGEARNRGGPAGPCRTNCEGQAGRGAQRQEALSGQPGVGSPHSTQRQGASPEAGEGGDRLTQSAQATSAVRKTEPNWPTFLRTIAEKAYRNKHYRFGGLYRYLNQDVLRQCFRQLRRDAASGVDGVTFEEYEKNLEANLADLVGRLKRKAYRARIVRRKYIPKAPGKLRPLGIPVLEDKLL